MPEAGPAGSAADQDHYQIQTDPLEADFFVKAVSDDGAFKILDLPAGQGSIVLVRFILKARLHF